ncbi:MAG: sigma-54 dependent transcriptional regulator [bacterium]|nr:sigma-54 dependent transcriptional regulator [bacterium]
MSERILLVDDEISILEALKGILEDEGYRCTTAVNANEAIERIEGEAEGFFSAALLDIWMPGMDGLEFLDWLNANEFKAPVIMMSGHGTIETAVKATKKGAYDFIEKPLSLEKVLLTLKHALGEEALRRENELLKSRPDYSNSEIIGHSPEIKAVLEQIERAAPTDSWVLIRGDNGTGKELVAKQIHLKSRRRDRPFVALNCAAIPEDMIESELFGHEKGAFKGATKRKIGKFDQANGGTLFLDEIGDMSLKTQAKILRVLQEQQFERVGGTDLHHVDVRIIAASNKNLADEIDSGNFRDDLYYRLNVIPIEVPPLRERAEDIPVLIDYFIAQLASTGDFARKSIAPEALDSMVAYHWPGNIRELKNIVERMVIMVREPVIELNHVPPVIRLSNAEVVQVGDFPKGLNEALLHFEGQFIDSALKKNGWNLSQTADQLDLKREQLQAKIKQFQIAVPTREG